MNAVFDLNATIKSPEQIRESMVLEIQDKRRTWPPILTEAQLNEIHARIEEQVDAELAETIKAALQKRTKFPDAKAEFYFWFYVIAGAIRMVQFQQPEESHE